MKRTGLLYFTLSLILAIAILLPGTLHAAKQCGDANNDDQLNIFDVTYIISYLYLDGPAPLYPYLCDVNNSDNIDIFDITHLISYLYLSGSAPDCPPGPGDPLASVISFGGCKTFEGGAKDESYPPEMDCISYSYDGDGVLTLKHINAGFNCCPGEIVADITIEDNIITIVENEIYDDTLGPCYCLCLFDVDYEIINLPPGEYTIQVEELYLWETDDPLVFTVDLSIGTEGDFCLQRDYYPWDFEYGAGGRMTGNFGCRLYDGAKDDPSLNEDCAEYSYDGESVLILNHINAAFNCCPVICANITIDDSIIIITESETYDSLGPCDCLCLFDVYYELTDIQPQVYIVRFVELCLNPEDEPLEFTIDLSSTPSGSHCVYRYHYPWGYENAVSGNLTDIVGCKTVADKDDLEEDCIVYEYDGSGTLSLSHINDVFNCCPDTIMVDFSFDDNIITITETESLDIGGGCDCICIFDLFYEITNLPPDIYTVRVDNTYYYNYLNCDIIEFTVDLTTTTSGYFCVDRYYLPWIY